MHRRQPTIRIAALAALFVLLAAAPAHALDLTTPAQLHILVRDDDGQPLAGVAAALSGPIDIHGESLSAQTVTDDAGRATLELRRPDKASDPDWTAGLRLTHSGYLAQPHSVRLFPGAQIDRLITLHKERRTLIRLRGPADESLTGVPLHFINEDVQYPGPRTDARGEYVYVHPPFMRGFGVAVSGEEARHCDDVPEVTLRYSAAELPATLPPRKLALRVLTDEGQPAVGWLLTTDAFLQGGGGIMPSTSITQFYQCESFERLDAQGAAAVELVNDLLFVVSPEGVPFQFSVNSAAWPGEIRRLTLRIPPVRETHAGQLVWQDGKPAARVPLVVQDSGNPLVRWQLAQHRGWFDGVPLWRAVVAGGSAVHPLTTDADGHYKLPLYFGGQAQFGLVSREYWTTGFDRRDKMVLKPIRAKSAGYRDVTIVFRDTAGQALPEVEIGALTTYHGKQPVAGYSRGGAVADLRGWHVLVPDQVDSLELDSNSAHWFPRHEFCELPAADTELVFVLPESARRKVLSGVVLDPAGQPVPDVRIHKCHPLAERRRLDQYVVGGEAKTDAQGRFAFEGLPSEIGYDQGSLAIFRRGPPGETGSLPGWIDEIPYDPDSRDIIIRLQPCGSVRVLLSAGAGVRPKFHLAVSPKQPEWTNYYHFEYDAATNSIVSPYVRPGRYRLRVDKETRAEQAADDARQPAFDVVVGRETTVDLRAETFPLAAPRADQPIAICLEHDGQPVAGARLTAFELPTFDMQTLRGLIGNDVKVNEYKLEQFQQAGIAALDPIRKLLASDGADLQTAGRSLEEYCQQYFSDGLKLAGADTSDVTGHACLLAIPGRRYVAVARLPGRLVGYQVFEAHRGQSPRVELHRSRTLEVHVACKPSAYAGLMLRLPGLSAEQAAALAHAGGDPGYGGLTALAAGKLCLPLSPTSYDDSAQLQIYRLEDLPIGLECELQLTNLDKQSLEKTVTIEDQRAPIQTFDLALPSEPDLEAETAAEP